MTNPNSAPPLEVMSGEDGLQGNKLPIQRHWSSYENIKVKVSGLRTDVGTLDVADIFAKEGNITRIKLLSNPNGSGKGVAIVEFSPPPKQEFWKGNAYRTRMRDSNLDTTLRVMLMELVQPNFYKGLYSGKQYPETMTLSAASLDFGILYDEHSMMTMYETQALPHIPIMVNQSLRFRQVEVCFPVRFRGSPEPDRPGGLNRDSIYKFVISHALPMTVFEVAPADSRSDSMTLVISVEFPPEFSRKYEDRQTHKPGSEKWQAKDAWYRSVDILYDFGLAKTLPARLNNTTSLINIGRWTTYRLVFDLRTNDQMVYRQFLDALNDFNIPVRPSRDFKFMHEKAPSVFTHIDPNPSLKKEFKSFADELLDNSVCHLNFEVRYQLEVCISEGWLSQYNLSRKFVEKLNALDTERAKAILVGIAIRKRRVFDPMTIFEDTKIKKPRRKIPDYAFHAHTATVTPTTIYFGTPSVEISNRVIRRFAEHADRFLRVRFTDEKPKGNIYGTDRDTMNEVFTRVKRVLMNGIIIGDRHYEFLAFGNSQFRENGAYFFCALPHLSAAKIRKWMGNFADIKIVAKYAARLGQCFSTTRAVHGARVTIKELEDVYSKDGRHNFTDGVGIISKFLAQVAASEIGALTSAGEPPSAIQFRLGGCKGVLVVWPLANKREIYIRKSQHKFDADHEGLEVIRWSQFSAAHLNRQLIAILTTLGVPDEVFLNKLDQQLDELSEAMENPQTAVRMLQREIDPNQMTLEIAEMVNNRFHMAREPFMMSILHLWRAFSIKYLKEKAKLVIEDGAILLGCVDESGKLQGHYDRLQAKSKHGDVNALPQIFIQISTVGQRGNGKPKVIEGAVVLARNPSLHPGDLRVVRAVNIPELHHLKDVVVLPKTGDRDLAGMCSGGDLDGDDFLVFWDKDLIPDEWNHEPMDYTAPSPLTVEKQITVDDLTSFFVRYMKNDSLGNIATAHLATADDSPEGAKDDRCLELTRLHSMAVDYAKSGQPAQMPLRLKPRRWPHFMENRSDKYHSKTALGKLYDRVELVDFIPVYDLPFDKRVIEAYSLDEPVLQAAASIKVDYDDAVRRIMAQHDIGTEFEIWSTFVLHHVKQKKDYKFHEEIGQLSITLKDTFRDRCYNHVGGREYEKLAPFVAAMYTVTSRQISGALKDIEKQAQQMSPELSKQMPMMSFPWLFPTVLGEIAMGRARGRNNEGELSAPEKRPQNWQKQPPQRPSMKVGEIEEDVLQTRYGEKHRGDTLQLFSSNNTKISHAEDVIEFIASSRASSSEEQHPALGSQPPFADLVQTRDSVLPHCIDEDLEQRSFVGHENGENASSDGKEEAVVPMMNKPSLLNALAELNN